MKFKNVFLVLVFGIAVASISSCANSGGFMSSHNTNVELSENNYEIVATNLSGESVVGYVFGASFSLGAVSHSAGLFRAEGTGNVYEEALEALYASYENEHGSMAGSSVAFINVRYDTDMLNLFFYTELKVKVRADVVRFVD